MSRSSKSMRVGPRCGGAPPAEAVAGAAGMGVLGAIGSKAAFAADPEEELDALAGDALAVDAVLLLALLELLEALDLDEDDFEEDDFFEVDFAAVLFEVAAVAEAGRAIDPASVDTSATTRSAVRARMGRERVNRTLWRAVNACTNAIPLTNFVNHLCSGSAQLLTSPTAPSRRTHRRARWRGMFP